MIAKSHKGEELLVLNTDLQAIKVDDLEQVVQGSRDGHERVEESHSSVKDRTNNDIDEGSADGWGTDSRDIKP